MKCFGSEPTLVDGEVVVVVFLLFRLTAKRTARARVCVREPTCVRVCVRVPSRYGRYASWC